MLRGCFIESTSLCCHRFCVVGFVLGSSYIFTKRATRDGQTYRRTEWEWAVNVDCSIHSSIQITFINKITWSFQGCIVWKELRSSFQTLYAIIHWAFVFGKVAPSKWLQKTSHFHCKLHTKKSWKLKVVKNYSVIAWDWAAGSLNDSNGGSATH